MKFLFTADMHLDHRMGTSSLMRFADIVESSLPDAIIVVGDLSPLTAAKRSIGALRDVAGNIPIAVCLGNHDYFAAATAARDIVSRSDVILMAWLPACEEFGVTLLDVANFTLKDMTIVGGYGHYDYQLAIPGASHDDGLYTAADFAFNGIATIGNAMWSDRECMRRDLDDLEFAQVETDGFSARAAMASGRIIAAIHTVPFPELDGWRNENRGKWELLSAYSGSSVMGRAVEAVSPEALVTGHTHKMVPPFYLNGTQCLNVGGAYGRPEGWLYDTDTRLFSHCMAVS